MLRILLYELDRQTNQDYRRALTSAGFTVRNASSVSEISEILAGDGGDLLLTELEPGDAGMEIIRMVRHSEFPIPVIVVTARDGMEELILRIRAVMRRAGQLNGDRHTLGNTTVNYSSMRVETRDGPVILPQKEFLLLYQLFSFPGRAFTKQQLKDDIWGFESNSDMHTVEVHIARLREKFRKNRDFVIETVRGVGYKVVPKGKNGNADSE